MWEQAKAWIDGATEAEARQILTRACGSTRWIDRMMSRRPFGSDRKLLFAARNEWFGLTEADWLEAFSHHPKIGDRASLEARFPATHELSSKEQAGVGGANAEVIAALADANQRYLERFGFIFIVCATGKSAEEMLGLLRDRLNNDRATELRIAAEEQARITALRLTG
ncbi:MAG TPA: 2-oxo-4-hydroxy-4-carboxy-5-ureidoimidazoline decarboxylase [Gemmatimonadaceae bacterium]|nr:2-oxo-4-hydroxy-4-carboxy-5-ureidoimidazoline decarboxylase [Gemmatimonadaceae bacterium]